MYLARFISIGCGIMLLMPHAALAAHYIRYNQLGYVADKPKSFVVLSTSALSGNYEIRGPSPATTLVLSGSIGSSVSGTSIHTNQAYNYRIDIPATSLTTAGTYTLTVSGQSKSFDVAADPYGSFLATIRRHIQVERSGNIGTPVAPRTGNSHTVDGNAPVYVSDGALTTGNWKVDPQGRTIDVSGGWYDAGDYIKFTTTIAYTTYFLLKAYELSGDTGVRTEAQYGLDYLLKVYDATRDLFVVQVGYGADHDRWPIPKPENDTATQLRRAHTALSKCQMGLASAALALGGRLLSNTTYKNKGKQIYDRAKTVSDNNCAFENNATNEFYRDLTYADNMALGAAEVYLAFGTASYKTDFDGFNGTGTRVKWDSVDLLANVAMYTAGGTDAVSRADSEVNTYRTQVVTTSNLWRLPSAYDWGSLNNWMSLAGAVGLYCQVATCDNEEKRIITDIVDYTLGKNNWGMSMVYSNNSTFELTARKVHDNIYTLSSYFPEGVLSEGPVLKSMRDAQLGSEEWRPPPLTDSRCRGGDSDTVDLHTFNSTNSSGGVYCDDALDYTTSEPVTYAQANALLMFAAAGADGGSCTPNCSGLTCGDDGCGGSCGTCSSGYSCSSGQCIASPCGAITSASSSTGYATWPQTSAGSTAAGTCMSGYGGSPTRQCSTSGSWGSISNACTPSTSSCSAITTASSSTGYATWPQTSGGSTASGTCMSGYSGSPTRSCSTSGTWGSVTNACTQTSGCSCPSGFVCNGTDQCVSYVGLSFSTTTTADWGSGYCVDMAVTNAGPSSTSNYKVRVPVVGTIYTAWGAPRSGNSGNVEFTFSGTLGVGSSNTSTGWCANR